MTSPGSARTIATPRWRSRVHPTTAVFAGVLVVSLVLRIALSWLRVTPEYFPDEYLYAALGRSLAGLHRPEIRGQATNFPALLQPLLTAPAWRAHSLATGYRIVQTIGAAGFTLAAIPTYILARRLGVSRAVAVAVGVLALLVPDAVYAGFVIAEPIAYPLVVGAVAAGVVAIARPSRRAQVLFLGLAALAAAARIQFVVLPACYLVAAAFVGLRERGLRRTVSEQRLVLGALAIVAVALAASGPSRLLGYYSNVLHPHVNSVAAASSLGRNVLVFFYASGWVLIPGAAIGLALALARPRTRLESAFGAITVTLVAALLVQASLFGDVDKVQERYVFYAFPLVAISFSLYASRGWPQQRIHALLGLGMLLLAARLTLAGYAQAGFEDHSPFLWSVSQLERRLGDGSASLLMGAVAGVLLLGVIAVARWQPKRVTAVALAAASAVCAVSYGAAFAFDRGNSASLAHRFLPDGPSWVDKAGVGPVTLVASYSGLSTDAEMQLWWNRSIHSVGVMGGGNAPDRMAASHIRVTADGIMNVHGRPLQGPLLLDGYGGTLLLRNASRVTTSGDYTLWQPKGKARLAMYIPGRAADGRLATQGVILLWPKRAGAGIHGWLDFTLRPPDVGRLAFRLHSRSFTHVYRADAGEAVHVRLRACSNGPWAASFSAPPEERVDLRVISGRSTLPRLRPDPAACA